MNRNLSGQQFEQLKMFMTPDEVIDQTHKLDTDYRVMHKSPREQWEHPKSGGHEPLRDTKLGNLAKRDWRRRPYETMPPLHIVHDTTTEAGKVPGPMLMDGHHRLALAEARGHPYVAVLHHSNDDEWDDYAYDASNWKD